MSGGCMLSNNRVDACLRRNKAIRLGNLRTIGLAGRDGKAAFSAERARVAVSRAIRLAPERISKQDRDTGKLLSTTN